MQKDASVRNHKVIFKYNKKIFTQKSIKSHF